METTCKYNVLFLIRFWNRKETLVKKKKTSEIQIKLEVQLILFIFSFDTCAMVCKMITLEKNR